MNQLGLSAVLSWDEVRNGPEADCRRLLEKANEYRDFARWMSDRETIERLLVLTEELK